MCHLHWRTADGESAARVSAMICPYCSTTIAATWQPMFHITDSLGRTEEEPKREHYAYNADGTYTTTLQWMDCQQEDCKRTIVRVLVKLERWDKDAGRGGLMVEVWSDEWIAVPQVSGARKVDPLVPENYARDY